MKAPMLYCIGVFTVRCYSFYQSRQIRYNHYPANPFLAIIKTNNNKE